MVRFLVPFCRCLPILLVISAGGWAEQPEQRTTGSEETLGAQLVRNALQLELEGDNEYRALALGTALKQAPDYAPARWQLGQVQVDAEWVDVKAAMASRADDADVQAYERMRRESSNSSAAQATLARFCNEKGFDDRARLHWHRVAADPGATKGELRAAAKALQLQRVGNQVLDGWQVADLLAHRDQLASDFETWSKPVKGWAKALHSDRTRRVKEALVELRAVRDAGAVLALELLLSPLSEAAASEVVAVLTEIDGHEATESLARHALGAPWPQVAEQAAIALKHRPRHEYVPMLLNALQAPIQTSFRVRNVGGIVRYDMVASKEDVDANYLMAYSYQLNPRFGTREVVDNRNLRVISNPTEGDRTDMKVETVAVVDNRWRGIMLADVQAKLRMQRDQRRLNDENERIASENSRVFATLETATDEAYSREPTDWWEWWDEYNEVHEENPPKSTYYDYRWFHRPYDAGITTYKRATGTAVVYQIRLSCFPAGTPVWTETGLRRIESVQPGDRVLSQDPDTGELTFKLVIDRTVRPPRKLIGVTIDGETLHATKGHPFWVNGHGWRMAKLLEPDQHVHTVGGAGLVERVAEEPDRDSAFNLVVDDFGTYFVGKVGALVHDNTYRSPTTAVVPGLTLPRAELQAVAATH